jgi:hypothetical protein
VKLAVLIASAALVVLASGSAAASDTLTLRGYGSAVIDGQLGQHEWDGAGLYDFQANRSPAEGGGTVPATLYVMNDATNLYLALRVAVTDIDYSSFDMEFLASGQNPFAPGSDILRTQSFFFEDYHYHESSPNSWTWLADVDDGGTHDGTATVGQQDGSWIFEVSHPLNSGDPHDFNLTIPSHVRFYGTFWHCLVGPGCTTTHMPADGFGDLVVVSGSRIAPDTTITAGPAEGSQTSDYGDWEFTGSDDVTPVADLTYECKVDEGAWSSCETPYGPATTVDGWHTLSVRALDDMLNADPTPAQRRWRIDTASPSKPKVSRQGRMLFFSAKDSGTPSRQVRYRCSIDSKRLHACGASIRIRFPARRHVLRARAVDPAGNESDLRIVRLAGRRHSG